jgi:basic membrane protein A
VVSAVGLTLAGCNASAPAATPSDNGPSLILVTPEPIGANEFLQLSQTGIKKAAQEAGGTARVFQSQDVSQVSQQLSAAVAAKPDVVVAVGFEFADALAVEAPAHPKQQFLFVDACTTKPFPNVACAVFREHEAVYLAGVEAGLLTKSHKVGAVVALDTPQIRRYADPFGAGAKSVADVQFTPLFVGGSNPFNDPGRAKEQALTLANDGADVIIAASSGGNAGVFDAAHSAGFIAVGVDTNQCPQAPGVVLDNVLKEVDVVIESSVGDILSGKTGGLKSYGLAEKAMSLTALQSDVATSQCLIADHPDVIKKVKEVDAQIVSGKIKVADPEAAAK